MKIAHLQRFSLIDYPGGICATLFTRGCTFRCPWCHNPELVEARIVEGDLSSEGVLDFLKTRQGKLDAVTITGGEPTLQGNNLLSFARSLKNLGFLVKIDTNGSAPDMLIRLIGERLVDYIAMDVKGPLDSYRTVAGVKVNPETIRRSIRIIMESAPDYEFRTTLVKSLLSAGALEETAESIRGARRYFLQKMENNKILDPSLPVEEDYSEEELRNILEGARSRVSATSLRGW